MYVVHNIHHLGLRFPSLFYPAVLFLDLGSNKPSFQIDSRTPWHRGTPGTALERFKGLKRSLRATRIIVPTGTDNRQPIEKYSKYLVSSLDDCRRNFVREHHALKAMNITIFY